MRKFTITENDKLSLCTQAPEFSDAVKNITLSSFDCPEDIFQSLAESIVSQQLSTKAADTIFARFKTQLGEVTPENIIVAKDEDLRATGLSMRKVEYVKNIAHAAANGDVDFQNLEKLDDNAIITELTKLKGVGVWTVEMLLIFALGRKDILSYKDLGIRRGIITLYKLDDISEKDFETYRKRYSPYGSLASLYLWRIKNLNK